MRRWIAVAAVLAVVGGLFVWQWRRERLVDACLATGGVWDGPTSRCLPKPPSPILKRGIERG